MIKKESTKLGYIADYKKDVDDIISLLQTYPDNAEMKKNFLSSVVEMVERTYDLTYDSVFDDIENFEKILPNKLEKLSQKISPEMDNTFWGCMYSISKNLGSEDEANDLILEYIEDSDFWFETSLFKLTLLSPITEDFSNVNIFSNAAGNIMLETLSRFSAQNLLVSNDDDLISCIKCGEIPLYPELRDLVPNYLEDAYPEYLYKNI